MIKLFPFGLLPERRTEFQYQTSHESLVNARIINPKIWHCKKIDYMGVTFEKYYATIVATEVPTINLMICSQHYQLL